MLKEKLVALKQGLLLLILSALFLFVGGFMFAINHACTSYGDDTILQMGRYSIQYDCPSEDGDIILLQPRIYGGKQSNLEF